MRTRIFIVAICLVSLSLTGWTQSKKPSKSAGPTPDQAYLKKLLDGWNTMDPANMRQYYAQGNYTFFDIAPLKYKDWDDYQQGVTNLLKGYKSFKLTLNDDAQIHHQDDVVWTTATIGEEAVTAAGKREMATMRWTVIFQKMDGKWLIVHEHTSEPVQ